MREVIKREEKIDEYIREEEERLASFKEREFRKRANKECKKFF